MFSDLDSGCVLLDNAEIVNKLPSDAADYSDNKKNGNNFLSNF